MRKLLIALSAMVLLATHPAQSQGPTQPPASQTTRINLSLEQKHTIKELIKDLKIPPASTSAKLVVGDAAPQGIVLQAIPVEVGQKVPQIRTHQFVVVADQIAIVDPKDRKVVELIELKS